MHRKTPFPWPCRADRSLGWCAAGGLPSICHTSLSPVSYSATAESSAIAGERRPGEDCRKDRPNTDDDYTVCERRRYPLLNHKVAL